MYLHLHLLDCVLRVGVVGDVDEVRAGRSIHLLHLGRKEHRRHTHELQLGSGDGQTLHSQETIHNRNGTEQSFLEKLKLQLDLVMVKPSTARKRSTIEMVLNKVSWRSLNCNWTSTSQSTRTALILSLMEQPSKWLALTALKGSTVLR